MEYLKYTVKNEKGEPVITVYPYCVSGSISWFKFTEHSPQMEFSNVPMLVFKPENKIQDLVIELYNLPYTLSDDYPLVITVTGNSPAWLIPYLVDYYSNHCSILILYDYERHTAIVVHSNNKNFPAYRCKCILISKSESYIGHIGSGIWNIRIACKPNIHIINKEY